MDSNDTKHEIINSEFYYEAILACKYDIGASYSNASESIYLFYDQIDGIDSLTLKTYLLFAQSGILHKDWGSASSLKEYYTRVEVDSAKAREYEKLLWTYMDGYEPLSEDSIEEMVESYMNGRWQEDRDKPHVVIKFLPPDNHPYFDHTYEGCGESIQEDGNIQAYVILIEMARKDKRNPYAFNECLYYCMLMANKYSYEPAFGHVREILLSFYPGQPIEEMDEITQQLIQLYTKPNIR